MNEWKKRGMIEVLEGRHQEVAIGNGRIIVTEEGIVFSGGSVPILADPVEELRTALDEIERLRNLSSSTDGASLKILREKASDEEYSEAVELSESQFIALLRTKFMAWDGPRSRYIISQPPIAGIDFAVTDYDDFVE